ncbi:MAG: DF family (seleno)protein, partial [bacterium]
GGAGGKKTVRPSGYTKADEANLIMRIDFLYWEDCPSHPDALARLRQVLREEGLPDDVSVIRIDTQEDADRHRFPGSPTIRFDGEDIQPEGVQGQAMLTCRTFRTEDGRLSPLPTATMIRRALHRRRASKGGS